MPLHDAALCVDSNQHPSVWRPWDDKTLATLPIECWSTDRLVASQDETKIFHVDGGDVLLWNLRTENAIRLNGGNGVTQPGNDDDFSTASLSPDGAKLATFAWWGSLSLWNLEGSSTHLLVRRQVSNGILGDRKIAFASDGLHLLYADGTLTYILDSRTFAAHILTSVQNCSGDLLAQWLHGGKELVLAGTQRKSGSCIVQIFDSNTARQIHAWTLPDLPAQSLVISPDSMHVVIASGFVGSSACIDDPISNAPTVRRILPESLPAFGSIRFFPDSRRLLVSSIRGGDPGIIDVTTNTNISILRRFPTKTGAIPPLPPVVGLLVANDGRHVALRRYDGSVETYDHVYDESKWGILGSPWFAVLFVLLLAAVGSLWWDAGKIASIDDVPVAGPAMVAASILALIALCGNVCAGTSVANIVNSANWPIALVLFWLPSGLCIRAGSTAWKWIGVCLLLLSGFAAISTALATSASKGDTFLIFDRTHMFAASQIVWFCFLWLLLAVVCLGSLAVDLVREKQFPAC